MECVLTIGLGYQLSDLGKLLIILCYGCLGLFDFLLQIYLFLLER